MNEIMDEWTNAQMNLVNEWIYEYMIQEVSCYTSDNDYGWMNEWNNEWMNE